MSLLLGIDGGASGVRLHRVEQLESGRLGLEGPGLSRDWTRVPGFEPVALERQLEERDAPRLSELERAQGEAWVDTLVDLISEGARGAAGSGLRLGLCLPGLKSAGGRGLAVLRRGPRVPDLARQLEQRLALNRPITRLHDDGDAAAWGEEWAQDGALSDVASAYVLAPGTGLAEGLKVLGRFPRVGELREVLPAPWSSGDEDRLGMHGLHARLGGRLTIDEAALGGDAAARGLLEEWARDLALFLADRLRRLTAAGLPVERVVVGARGGQLLAHPDLAQFTRLALEKALSEQCHQAMTPGLIIASRLRAAPAIGAAAEALGLVEHA